MNTPTTIAVHESEYSFIVIRFVEVSTLSMAVQQLILNDQVHGLHEDPLGNIICVDSDGNRYPAYD